MWRTAGMCRYSDRCIIVRDYITVIQQIQLRVEMNLLQRQIRSRVRTVVGCRYVDIRRTVVGCRYVGRCIYICKGRYAKEVELLLWKSLPPCS